MPTSSRRFDSRPAGRSSTSPQLIRLVLGLVVVLVAMYFAWQKAQERPQPREPAAGIDRPVEIKTIKPETVKSQQEAERGEPATDPEREETPPRVKTATEPAVVARITNQKIRNQDGKVVFQGTIDLQDTLDRISRGERGSHSNDGSVFQNREKRLPIKPAGYYREWVHPTPKLRGPGPQRIVTGKEGEIYYTPDHYETFRRIDGG
jgi:guanyl-specific ribonuclease Sa